MGASLGAKRHNKSNKGIERERERERERENKRPDGYSLSW